MSEIVITVPDLGVDAGGVAHFYDRIAPFLPERVESVVVGRRSGESTLAAAARMIADWARLWRLLGRGDVGLLHVNPSLDGRALIRDGGAAFLARLRHVPTVVFVRGWQESTEAAIDRGYAPLFRLAFGRAAAFIVLSSRFRAVLRRWGYRGAVHTATTAVPQSVAAAVDEDMIAARCRREGPLTALFLGRILADKGIYQAMEAVRLARHQGVDLRLVVAGAGPELPRAARWANERDFAAVTFVGDVRGDAKHEVMNGCDLFLFPSIHGEGMPASVLEAMTYGMTVIACPTGGLRDFFRDGEHGLLCPTPDPAVLARAILRAADDAALRGHLGIAAQRFALEHFTAARAAARLLAVYAGVESAARGVDSDWYRVPETPADKVRT